MSEIFDTKITFTRQTKIGDFEYENAQVAVSCDLPATALSLIPELRAQLDELMPQFDTSPKVATVSITAPVAPTPAPQPPLAAPAAPANYGAAPPSTTVDLAFAESVLSPCGESIGQPLSSCTDKDLEYLAMKYKKDQAIKQCAATVLAARRMGQTTRHA